MFVAVLDSICLCMFIFCVFFVYLCSVSFYDFLIVVFVFRLCVCCVFVCLFVSSVSFHDFHCFSMILAETFNPNRCSTDQHIDFR